MLVISNGAMKSGSTWLTAILLQMVDHQPLPPGYVSINAPGSETPVTAPAPGSGPVGPALPPGYYSLNGPPPPGYEYNSPGQRPPAPPAAPTP